MRPCALAFSLRGRSCVTSRYESAQGKSKHSATIRSSFTLGSRSPWRAIFGSAARTRQRTLDLISKPQGCNGSFWAFSHEKKRWALFFLTFPAELSLCSLSSFRTVVGITSTTSSVPTNFGQSIWSRGFPWTIALVSRNKWGGDMRHRDVVTSIPHPGHGGQLGGYRSPERECLGDQGSCRYEIQSIWQSLCPSCVTLQLKPAAANGPPSTRSETLAVPSDAH